EDGIRDPLVTGVQTCALPIYRRPDDVPKCAPLGGPALPIDEVAFEERAPGDLFPLERTGLRNVHRFVQTKRRNIAFEGSRVAPKIGRASWRERGATPAGG